jgi:hypothetical protein
MSAQTNGQVRKSLASQLDRHEEIIGRLEGTIDALADGLNQAVAMVVQESVTAAVQAAVVEVLTNPELHNHLRQGLKPDKHERPANPVVQAAKHLWSWLLGGVAHVVGKVVSFVRMAWNKTTRFLGACKKSVPAKVADVAGKTKAVVQRGWAGALGVLRFLWPSRKLVLVAVVVGVALALGTYCCGPVVSSVLNGIAGFAAAIATGPVKLLRRLVTGDKVAST